MFDGGWLVLAAPRSMAFMDGCSLQFFGSAPLTVPLALNSANRVRSANKASEFPAVAKIEVVGRPSTETCVTSCGTDLRPWFILCAWVTLGPLYRARRGCWSRLHLDVVLPRCVAKGSWCSRRSRRVLLPAGATSGMFYDDCTLGFSIGGRLAQPLATGR